MTLYSQRYGIEAMFKDCHTGGYNLEGCQASPDKLIALMILIALAMTKTGLQGKEPSFKDRKNMYAGSKSQGEIEEDIASFGLVCMAKIG